MDEFLETEPKRPWDVYPAGSLVVHVNRWPGVIQPCLVLETKVRYGNPNDDNTANHWYWTYLLYEEDGNHAEVQARYYKEFKA